MNKSYKRMVEVLFDLREGYSTGSDSWETARRVGRAMTKFYQGKPGLDRGGDFTHIGPTKDEIDAKVKQSERIKQRVVDRAEQDNVKRNAPYKNGKFRRLFDRLRGKDTPWLRSNRSVKKYAKDDWKSGYSGYPGEQG